MDTKTKQVAIEARIVLATSSFQRTLAATLTGSFLNHSGSTVGAGQTGSSASVTPAGAMLRTSVTPGFTIPANASTGFGVFAITNYSSRYLINATISASELRNEAKTISRPTVITQNNVAGMVQQGVQLPVQTSINNTIAVQYVNATLQLRVTPQITDDGHIFLDIDVKFIAGVITNSAGRASIPNRRPLMCWFPTGGPWCSAGLRPLSVQNLRRAYLCWRIYRFSVISSKRVRLATATRNCSSSSLPRFCPSRRRDGLSGENFSREKEEIRSLLFVL